MLLLASFVLICLYGCGNGYETVKLPEEVPPSHVRVTGTVIKVYEEMLTMQGDSPCSKVPCMARVKVDKVHSLGMGFSNPVSANAEYDVFFNFTTSKTTDELFPNLNISLPGVKAGDKFTADWKGNSVNNQYTVNKYVIVD